MPSFAGGLSEQNQESNVGKSLGQDRGGGAWSPSEMGVVAILPHCVPHPRIWLSCFAALGLAMGVLELLTILTAQLMACGMLEPLGLE